MLQEAGEVAAAAVAASEVLAAPTPVCTYTPPTFLPQRPHISPSSLSISAVRQPNPPNLAHATHRPPRILPGGQTKR